MLKVRTSYEINVSLATLIKLLSEHTGYTIPKDAQMWVTDSEVHADNDVLVVNWRSETP